MVTGPADINHGLAGVGVGVEKHVAGGQVWGKQVVELLVGGRRAVVIGAVEHGAGEGDEDDEEHDDGAQGRGDLVAQVVPDVVHGDAPRRGDGGRVDMGALALEGVRGEAVVGAVGAGVVEHVALADPLDPPLVDVEPDVEQGEGGVGNGAYGRQPRAGSFYFGEREYH